MSGEPEWRNWPIAVLVAYASPTTREVEGRPNIVELRDAARAGSPIDDKPDAQKAQACARWRDIARAELVRRYREAKRASELDSFDPVARSVVEELFRANGGKLPRLNFPNLGRPRDLGKTLMVHLAVLEELERLGGPTRGNVSKAIATVADRHKPALGVKRVSEIYYNQGAKWRKAVELEIAWRELQKELATQPKSTWAIESREITPEQFKECFKEYSALAAAEYPNGIPTIDANTELWSVVFRSALTL